MTILMVILRTKFRLGQDKVVIKMWGRTTVGVTAAATAWLSTQAATATPLWAAMGDDNVASQVQYVSPRKLQQSVAYCDVRSPTTEAADIVVVGAGIVGLSTARELKHRFPDFKISVVEKERTIAKHQTGHNSGVIHAGMYYNPESLKAKLCVKGNRMMYKYCEEKGIAYNRCGKLIVATDEEEIPRLKEIYRRGQLNQCEGLKWLEAAEIKKVEPHCNGVAAIHSTSTGIVDYAKVAESYASDFREAGGQIFLGEEVANICGPEGNKDFSNGIEVRTKGGNSFSAKYVVTCGGLHSDRLASKSGETAGPKIIPFRGEYLLLRPEKRHLVKGNIYPVPDPRVPFLGVHFTPRVDGSLWIGPNAVLAFAREGYSYTEINLSDLWEAITYGGFLKLIYNFFSYAVREFYRGLWLRAQVKQLQRYIPEITINDIERGPAGVRAQAVASDGSLVDDFIFSTDGEEASSHILHVRNAPSPAATSSLAIAEYIADETEKAFGLDSKSK